jgi:hypothetical protein
MRRRPVSTNTVFGHKIDLCGKLPTPDEEFLLKAEIFTFCDFAQESGGKLTIVGSFDTILARAYPCVHPQLSVVIRLRFDIFEFGKHTFRIETVGLDDEAHLEAINGNLEVKGMGNATAVTHLVFTISNIHFKSPGVVNFVLYMDNKELTSLPLYLQQQKS